MSVFKEQLCEYGFNNKRTTFMKKCNIPCTSHYNSSFSLQQTMKRLNSPNKYSPTFVDGNKNISDDNTYNSGEGIDHESNEDEMSYEIIDSWTGRTLKSGSSLFNQVISDLRICGQRSANDDYDVNPFQSGYDWYSSMVSNDETNSDNCVFEKHFIYDVFPGGFGIFREDQYDKKEGDDAFSDNGVCKNDNKCSDEWKGPIITELDDNGHDIKEVSHDSNILTNTDEGSYRSVVVSVFNDIESQYSDGFSQQKSEDKCNDPVDDDIMLVDIDETYPNVKNIKVEGQHLNGTDIKNNFKEIPVFHCNSFEKKTNDRDSYLKSSPVIHSQSPVNYEGGYISKRFYNHNFNDDMTEPTENFKNKFMGKDCLKHMKTSIISTSVDSNKEMIMSQLHYDEDAEKPKKSVISNFKLSSSLSGGNDSVDKKQHTSNKEAIKNLKETQTTISRQDCEINQITKLYETGVNNFKTVANLWTSLMDRPNVDTLLYGGNSGSQPVESIRENITTKQRLINQTEETIFEQVNVSENILSNQRIDRPLRQSTDHLTNSRYKGESIEINIKHLNETIPVVMPNEYHRRNSVHQILKTRNSTLLCEIDINDLPAASIFSNQIYKQPLLDKTLTNNWNHSKPTNIATRSFLWKNNYTKHTYADKASRSTAYNSLLNERSKCEYMKRKADEQPVNNNVFIKNKYDGLRGTAHSVHQTQKTSAEINRLRQNPVINKANTFNRKLQNSFNDISTRALDTIIKVNYLNSDNSPLRESPHNSHRYHTNSLHRTLNRSEQRLINQQRLIEKQMSTDIISPAEAYFIESCFSQLKEDQLSNGYTTYQNVLQSNREEVHFQNKTATALHEQGVDQHIPILRYATYSDILMDDDVFCLEF
ncbi:hypothetical protein GJ496_009851 [Pomphorhynchus laevis]|nr:hypothetical protein GJ496_009851 [Pomphorhynchus laevis]